jgi:hypothetical protein
MNEKTTRRNRFALIELPLPVCNPAKENASRLPSLNHLLQPGHEDWLK